MERKTASTDFDNWHIFFRRGTAPKSNALQPFSLNINNGENARVKYFTFVSANLCLLEQKKKTKI